MTGGDEPHGHPQQNQHQQHPRRSSEDVPPTLSSRPASFSSSTDGRTRSQPSAPATTATSSIGRGIAYLASLVVALCGLAGLLVSWIYYGDGGGGGLRPQKQQANVEGELLWLGGAGTRRNDSSADGGGGTRASVAGGGLAAGSGVREPQLEVAQEGHEQATSAGGGEGLTRRYSSFEDFASEQSAKRRSNETLGVPIVTSTDGPKAARSLPAAIIIGVQKGGTQNLRSHLLTHPQLSGLKGKEAHFFDVHMWDTPRRSIEWPGDGLDNEEPSPQAVGDALSAYADRCMETMAPGARDSKAGVESTPVYVFHPLVPYRIKMVLPRAMFILLLRDPTERYFSHLRMTMCSSNPGEPFESAEKRLKTYFHNPGQEEAKKYLDQGQKTYKPYTAICRGEKATKDDLKRCWARQQKHHPLQRGLYADQLERWFRVFDREQILIVDSGEMFADFTGTLGRVARHVGLPPHNFEYNPKHQHSSGVCERRRPELFAKGARYDQMLKDEEHFREWYRPHNQRLFELLGWEMPWE